jgi:hypothetical protein
MRASAGALSTISIAASAAAIEILLSITLSRNYILAGCSRVCCIAAHPDHAPLQVNLP